MSQDEGAAPGEEVADPEAPAEAAPPPPALPPAAPSQQPKSAQPRKEESPFSFKHFLKRDLSLPTTSSYESTGAKPKIYSNTVHPSPSRYPKINQENRKDGKSSTRESWAGPSNPASDSSIELILNTGSSNDSKSNILDMDHCDISSFRRSHTTNDALGMPSLPDFVQDHLLVEQAYLGGSNGPFTVYFDNLPDFALPANTNYDNEPSSDKQRDYCDFNSSNYSNTGRIGNCQSVPLDLPSFIEDRAEANERVEGRCRPSPLDLPNNLSLDLTESLNHERRDNHSRHPFPLDLPGNENPSGNESLRLPDFLPAQAGSNNSNSSNSGSSTRDELAEERRLRINAERELRAAQQNASGLRRELQAARNAEQHARRELLEARTASTNFARELRGAGRAGGSSTAAAYSSVLTEEEKKNINEEDSPVKLKQQIMQLRAELASSNREIDNLRSNQRGVARSLNLATSTAENSLKDLLSGLEQLRCLSSSLDRP